MSTSGSMLHEYSIPTANAAPNSITLGPDGNLWFTESGSDDANVATITTTGKVTEYPRIPTTQILLESRRDRMAISGLCWETQTPARLIRSVPVRMTSPPTITQSRRATLTGSWLTAMGISGSLSYGDNQVGELNPTTGITTEFTSPTSDSGPAEIALGEMEISIIPSSETARQR